MTPVRDGWVPELGRRALVRRGATVHAGLVALPGAQDGGRDQPLFDRLAGLAVPEGCAVLTFDRRAPVGAGDVPLADQAADALAALRWLAAEYEVPVGLFGFSQGAWAAALAASLAPGDLSRLLLVGCSGVSPAQQMRWYVDESLRRAGHDETARRTVAGLRAAYEDVLRGTGDRAATQRLLDRAAGEPWFELAWLPRELPATGSWGDLDFDPEPVFAQVRCPVLLVYGEDEDTVPVPASVAAWQRAAPGRAEVAVLPGAGHDPGDHEDYGRVVADWLRRR